MPTSDLAQQVFARLDTPDSGESSFVAIPGNGEPRWLLPGIGGNFDSVLSNWTAYRFSSRMQWTVVRAATRFGLLACLPQAAQVRAGDVDSIDWRRWGWYGQTPPLPVVYVGTPGTCRKAVVHLVDGRSGACRMVVKVPLTERAGEAILREAGVLDALAREPRVRAPRLLEVDRQRGIASQGFIAGTPGDRKLTAEHCGLLGSLLLENETTTIIGYAAALQEQVLLLPGQLRELLSDALSQLSASRLLPACWTHGDFAPWNIRHCPDGTPVLIDWESAHRGGLPLHDAFHFLHMQDYLFSHRAHSHCAAVRDYGLSLDLSADECRQLEIAYLVSAYLSCTEQEETRRADFHLSALDLLFRRRRRRQVQVTEAAYQPLANAVRNAQGRTELFAAALSQFNLAEIPYCLLGGHENRAASADSDVDVMVASHELTRVGSLLAQVARTANAMLVQALRHESSACYFVLAKAEGTGFSFLDVDCCGDYRRRGRLWLRASPILARRKACRNLFVPAASDQFIYYTIKKILKQSISAHQLKRLQHLYARDPVGCQENLGAYWTAATAQLLQRAITKQDLSLMLDRLPELLSELKHSASVEGRIRRWTARARELARRVRRVLQPTGVTVCITGGDERLQSEVSQLLVGHLSPAFRRTGRVSLRGTLPDFSLPPRLWLARIRSTLAVAQLSGPPEARPVRVLMRMLRPDLVLHLGTFADVEHAEKTPTVYVDANKPAPRIAQQAAQSILQLMAARVESRRFSRVPDIEAATYPQSPPAAVHSPSPGLD